MGRWARVSFACHDVVHSGVCMSKTGCDFVHSRSKAAFDWLMI